jgi:hypothetical protein
VGDLGIDGEIWVFESCQELCSLCLHLGRQQGILKLCQTRTIGATTALGGAGESIGRLSGQNG